MKPTDQSSTVALFATHFPQIAQELGAANLALLLDGATVQEIAPGRAVIRDRMPADFIYFVLEGTLGAYIEDGGKSRRIGSVKPGEWMGEISVLSGELLASATVITDSVCKVVRVHHITFGNLIADNESVAKVLLDHFIALMAQRLRAPLAQS